uniref:uncharacterized protein LOC122603059 n=1 Tax=Erigeron canadensis TaxID=72917 RepID=UPI001CB8CC77|nr:uncharacterized protein LOC122603059 [Erigeron canadensis]
MRIKNAKEAWEVLKEEFQGDVKVKAIKLQSLRQDYENMKMKENESLNDYSSRLTDLVNQMKSYGDEIDDQRIVEKILITIPEKFDPIIAVIENTKDLKTLGIQELLSSLKSYEQHMTRHTGRTIESAFQSGLQSDKKPPQSYERGSSFRGGRGGRNFRGRGRGQSYGASRPRFNFERKSLAEANSYKCSICKKDNHDEKDCWNKGKFQCSYCNRFGHLEKFCQQKNQQQQANYSEEKQKDGNVFFCHSATVNKTDIWFLDNGCSNHMTGDESILVNIDTTIKSHVKMGNGAVVQVKGKGKIPVETKRGTKYINDVLLVPDLDQNLLSV